MNTVKSAAAPGASRTPVRRLLVANRGEIAVRIIRSAHEMGIETVAVWSTADKDAPHVRLAGSSVCIGAPPSSASYLNIDAIIEAAKSSGADAIHPGYGFLSENADFALACVAAGLTFVGPSAEAIETMSDKARAKQFMAAAGLPCVPGYDGAQQDPQVLEAEALRIGYPVIVKAMAGGGGRGMRLVEEPSQFAQLLGAAQREAQNAFGDDRVMIERYVANPRHIEIQVLLDQYGNGVHFGERDCSVQRRHQKLVEEAPAPHLAPELRDRLGSVAVAAAAKLGYCGVGTFEFLCDSASDFYFMEMNTRLQVEHPVTEEIVGEDLVAWQLRVAQGEELTLHQNEIRFQGHAIEARLCAEDEANGFMPQSGAIRLWDPAGSVRVDHAICSGDEITPFYDSMFAKLIAHGRDREEARRKLVMALRETVVFGIRTNREALIRILEHPSFVAGGVDTGFMLAHHADLVPESGDDELPLAVIAGGILCHNPDLTALHTPSLLLLRDHEDQVITLQVGKMADGVRVRFDERVFDFDLRYLGEGRYSVASKGVLHPVRAHLVGDTVFLQLHGRAVSFEDVTYRPAPSGAAARTDGRVTALSNGQVVSVLVVEGDLVEPGTPLATVEAMKMEHLYTAAVAGTVASVNVSAGDFVNTGRLLVKILVPDQPRDGAEPQSQTGGGAHV